MNLQRVGMAGDIFGRGLTYEQLREAINAARRGEGNQSLALFLQYLTNLINAWA
jgi:hypothetical protein